MLSNNQPRPRSPEPSSIHPGRVSAALIPLGNTRWSCRRDVVWERRWRWDRSSPRGNCRRKLNRSDRQRLRNSQPRTGAANLLGTRSPEDKGAARSSYHVARLHRCNIPRWNKWARRILRDSRRVGHRTCSALGSCWLRRTSGRPRTDRCNLRWSQEHSRRSVRRGICT
ncbi:hypothetical protein ACHAXT_004041 [Thalassiosira profunda]